MDSVTLVFLFSDIQGSTVRWQRDRAAMADAVRRHDRLLKQTFTSFRGHIFKTVGDEFCVAFSAVSDAVAAAREAQCALAREDWSAVDGLAVRMAIHAGAAEARDDDYFGPALNKVARILAIGHGGQILLSKAASELAADDVRDAELRYLGRHRLKDFDELEHVYQLCAPGLPDTFPPLRALEEFPNNLPVQLTSFVGREAEIEHLQTDLRSERLVSVVGTGGVGKTRLAVQVAMESLHDFADGTWFIDLSAVDENEAVAAATASVLSIRLAARQSVLDTLAMAVRDKHMMLIFDSCEKVLDATAEAIETLLRASPFIKVIVTSREALDFAGERVHELGTLAVPPSGVASPADALQYAAVDLFVARAQAASRRFALTAENAATVGSICRRLDGIPLALELAAPKLAVLSAAQLAVKLDERFRVLVHTSRNRLPRQQTLHALIDWSYDLLDDRQRAVFRRLGVFAGRWSAADACAVCSDESIDEWDVAETLGSLVAKSLVVAEPCDGDEQPYRLLNSIGDYARERLSQSGEAAAYFSRHARFYARYVCERLSLVEAMEDVRWKDALEPEIDNIRSAVDWAVCEAHEFSAGIELLSGLEWPELLVAPLEAIRWFDAAAPAIDSFEEDIVRARFWRNYVRLEWLTGRSMEQREKSAAKGAAAAQACGDANELARALCNLGICSRDAERYDEADVYFRQAYQTPDALSAMTINTVLRNWAVMDLQAGNLERARRRFSEVVRLERPGSEAHASALLNLGELEFAAGNIAAARDAANSAKETFVKLNGAPLGLLLCNLAAYAIAADAFEEARETLREALRVLEQTGARWIVTALEHHAVLAGVTGNYEDAALLLGYTDSLCTENAMRQRTERAGYERLVRELTKVFDAEELSTRMRAGARLTAEQAVAHAIRLSNSADQSLAAAAAD